jgi:hypothetical protein
MALSTASALSVTVPDPSFLSSSSVKDVSSIPLVGSGQEWKICLVFKLREDRVLKIPLKPRHELHQFSQLRNPQA